MRPTTSQPGRVLPALLTAAVAAIVLGILGMHALNTHGVASNTDHATAAMPMPATHADMPAAHSDHLSAGFRSDTAVDTASDPAGGHDMGDMVMLCIAMLAAAAGALLILLGLVRSVTRLWAYLPAAPLTLTKRVTARLGTGPPPVWEYSVIRC